MVNKRGFLRIVEATIAVLIILGALFVITSQKEIRSSSDLTGILRRLLDEIAKNQELRSKIVNYNLSEDRDHPQNKEILENLDVFLDDKIKNPALNYSVSICSTTEICYIQESYPVESPEDIYAAERIITTSLSEENPDFQIRKIKLFLWRRV